jgi:hypothetical protein
LVFNISCNCIKKKRRFFVKINKGRNKAGVGVQLVFQVAQHIRDEELLKSFVTFFKCGHSCTTELFKFIDYSLNINSLMLILCVLICKVNVVKLSGNTVSSLHNSAFSSKLHKISTRKYSTQITFLNSEPSNSNLAKDSLSPWFITGFVDGEGCFSISITRSKNCKIGWRVIEGKIFNNKQISLSRLFSTSTLQPGKDKSIVNLKRVAETPIVNSENAINNGINLPLSSWFVTGFTDGEGCFWISIFKDKAYRRVKLYFEIHIHKKDLAILEEIKQIFIVGKIYKKNDNTISFLVTSIKDLQVIREHFDKYPLHTKKRADFELWKKAFNIILNKEHLTPEGLEKLIAIKASMNKGISPELSPKTNKVERPLFENIKVFYPQWLSGFVTGEGCFFVGIIKKSYRQGFKVNLAFKITQHSRDDQLMRSLIEFLGCGNLFRQNHDACEYRVTKFLDLTDKIIPLFKKFPILGIKFKDFEDFCKIADMMKKKEQLTEKGFNKICKIKAEMNKGRN